MTSTTARRKSNTFYVILIAGAAALSVAAAMQWIANFAVSTTFPPILQYFGLGAAYGLYTTAAAISLFFVLFFIKETKGIELEHM
ncbi:MFS transporter [Atlanticothrix silvestris]|uniref:MFS transporter n=1 Tax=Atlanticothrix silvestris TaxID=2840444 RepID=UPI001CEDEBBB|nr:MFS transporter [Atlanticothrix silvestris]